MGSTNMGGTQMFVLNLLKNMDLNRFHIDFVVNFPERAGGVGQELMDMGCNIYKLPYFRVYNYFSFTKAWNQFLTDHHYDIVHGHSSNSASVYLKIAKEKKCVTIAHSHSTGFRGGWIQQKAKIIFNRNIRNVADYWFSCSPVAAEHLFGKGYLEYKYYYDIPNAINAEKYRYNEIIAKKIRNVLGVNECDFLCGHVGSFTYPKNHTFLLEVFREILKMKPNARLLCCGNGELMPQLKEKSSALGIDDKVIFTGVVKNTNEYLMAMDVFVFPSLFEGFGIAILEAEATGLPVIMSNVVPDDVVLNDNVYKLSLDALPQEWAKKICNMASGQLELYNIKIVESKYNMKTCAKMVMSLYEEMATK